MRKRESEGRGEWIMCYLHLLTHHSPVSNHSLNRFLTSFDGIFLRAGVRPVVLLIPDKATESLERLREKEEREEKVGE